MDDKTIARVSAFLKSELENKSEKILIFKNEDGSYKLFNTYLIEEIDSMYKISFTNQDRSNIFSSLKNAVTWCIHDINNRISQANRIKDLDSLLSSYDVSIKMHERLLKISKDSTSILITSAKLTEEKLKRTYMINELNKYIIAAKNIQLKNFIMNDK